jgi:hypothetical protein
MNANPAYLTPSEHVYLNGEKFAPKAGIFGKTRLMHIEFDANVIQLVQAIFSAAFLTLEQQGTLRLEIRAKKVLFGLASAKGLFADSVGPMAAWPAQTIEAALPGLAYQLASSKGQNEVYGMVYAWLGQDSGAPFEEVLTRVKNGLAVRGLVETREERTLKIFTRIVYALPDATRQLALVQPIQPVQQLFTWCQQTRAEIWDSLNQQIKKAVTARQEKTDSDFDSD